MVQKRKIMRVTLWRESSRLVEVAPDAALHGISRLHEQLGLEREGVNN